MYNKVEKEISQLLETNKDVNKVTQHLADKYRAAYIPPDDFKALINFCIRAGTSPILFPLFEDWFREQKLIPWSSFAEILYVNKLTPDKELLDVIFTGAVEQDKLDELTTFKLWDSIDERFKNYRQRYTDELAAQLEQKKANLLSKIEYFQTHRMVDEEKRAIDALELSFPDSEQIPELKSQFKQKWAEHVIASSNRSKYSRKIKEQTSDPLTLEELQFATQLRDFCLKTSKNNSEKSYDFALMFLFMGVPPFALDLIRQCQPGASSDWLHIELLLMCQLYVEGLEKIDILERRYGEDPETVFATTYLRAKCFYEIGDQHSAVELMRHIVNIRPAYRSAHSLLIKWETHR